MKTEAKSSPSSIRPDRRHHRYRAALARLRPAFRATFALSAVVNLLMLTGSVYMLQVYDRVLSSGSLPTLFSLFAIVVLLYGFLGLFDALRGRILSRAAYRLDADLGEAGLAAHVASGLPGKGARAGALADLGTLRGFLAGPAPAALADLPFVPLFVGVLCLVHPLLGLLTIAGALAGAVIAWVNKSRAAPLLSHAAGLEAAERDFAERSRRNAETVAAMGMQGAVAARWQALHGATMATQQAAGEPMGTSAAASRAFRMLLQSAILTLGAFLVLRGEISAGMIIAASVLSGRALAPVDQIVGQWSLIARAGAAHGRLDALFSAEAAEPERIELPEFKGAVAALGLTRLADPLPGSTAERAKILEGISFSLEPGDGLGVIGVSASGKSTLARLLVGAGEPDAGEIRLDGARADQWDRAVLGRRIGYLPQQVDMLPGTVGENIARFDPACPDEAVIAAARMAGIHEMILKLPQGYATRIGESGATPLLSGGQMQRLGLARALCGMPALVVLDEPNANLDHAGDKALAEAILALRAAGSTVVVMAHRPGALGSVNKMLLLSGGKVRAFGPRDEVLAGLAARKEAAPTTAPDAVPAEAASVRAAAPAPAAAPVSPLVLATAPPARLVPPESAVAARARVPAVVRNAGPAHRRASA